jgi:hypothetical protein
MRPITFERQCHRCHTLKFDTFLPDRELMHGRPEDLEKQVVDTYAAAALRGGYEEPEAPAQVRRRVGTPLSTAEKKAVADWAVAKTAAVLNGRFGKGLCAECHDLVEGVRQEGMTWTVEPATLTGLYFPKAFFDHGKHRDVACVGCHAATESLDASDVLMPRIEACTSCHGGAGATDRVPSPCITCHAFHRKGLPPMRPVEAAAAAPTGTAATGRTR